MVAMTFALTHHGYLVLTGLFLTGLCSLSARIVCRTAMLLAEL